MADETRARFLVLVRAIDRHSKAGEHRQALWLLRDLLALGREDSRYSKKKSHLIAALAYRAVQAGQPDVALEFLGVADREIPDAHLMPMLRSERDNVRKAAKAAGGRG